MNKTIELDVCKGNKGLVVDLNNTRITNTRFNGVMKVIKSFDIKVDLLKEIIKEFETPCISEIDFLEQRLMNIKQKLKLTEIEILKKSINIELFHINNRIKELQKLVKEEK